MMARKGLLPYRVPLLDGAFWFSAQFVLASIWPTSPLLPDFPLPFVGSSYQLQLTECLLAWLLVHHLARLMCDLPGEPSARCSSVSRS